MYMHTWITSWVLSLECLLTLGFSYNQNEVIVYQKVDDPRNSSLSCLFCFNGDTTNDCMTLKNINNIPKIRCLQSEPYCKVRRLTREGNLVTFDRYCDSHCEPGCRDAAFYSECVSCCNDKPDCNVDNSAPSCRTWGTLQYVSLLSIVLIKLLARYGVSEK